MSPLDLPAVAGTGAALSREAVLGSMDRCTKCGICQAYCPVAGATGDFPGPKYAGPQAQRFRAIDSALEESAPDLCSGCGICTSVCPNGVAITDMIAIAKADQVRARGGPRLGQRLLNRPGAIGRLGGLAPALANRVISSRPLRRVAEWLFGIHRDAPLPRFKGPAFRRWLEAREQPQGPTVTYFTGCAVEHYDAATGIAAVRLLNALGYRVEAPSQACCSLPMLTSGEWDAAGKRATRLIKDLTHSGEGERPILSTSTSCALTVRDKYAVYLGREDAPARAVAHRMTDISAFLRDSHAERLAGMLREADLHVLYHGPCQQRGHHSGQPAVELLRLVPGLRLSLSEADCCGVAGTYGYDRDKHAVAHAVGGTLFERIAEAEPDLVVCDSETCRWHIEKETGVPAIHPAQLLADALTKPSDP